MNHTVCIVDDDPDLREVLSSALEYEGISTLLFESPLIFEAYLKETKIEDWPRLVLIDYFMPEMNGINFITYFRNKYKESGRIKFALSTAHQLSDETILPKDVILLQKPYDLDVLISTANQFAKS